ncbi:hypothetical protein BU23DRAFT_558578 [Bimuria novae-zelandiae CBS 107.79]|uniref:PH domain-containing protein n=1 Tax=Bimuria novae-zelandiae CBS 107.79 TaxID=1447943 RepID=A0A6A5UVB2_9PLEO|nr:hypothetical protein BU23DRAFT_558578 [Bimuria novae-zelandiae CBS 107.79]
MSAAVEHPLVEPQQSAPILDASAPETKNETPSAAAATEDKPTDAAASVEETPKTDGETVAAAPVEEKKEEKPIEPIYSGALGYKAPGLKNAFRFSKKYFWFGEDAAVPASSLSAYLRGEKAEVAHPTAAWSSVTGKGLLYFVKHADEKATPAGVLNLADATELTKDGTVAFHFKLHGHKHTFEAQTAAERNGWFVAVEKAIEEAKASKDSVLANETYKEELAKLGKPITLAPTVAAGSTPKKSTDVAPKPAEGEVPAAEESAAPARAGSSSSSSSDEEKKRKKAAKSKSRSVSRGKRSSIFGGFLGKKDKLEEKSEEKKEDETVVPAEPTAETSTAAPVAAPVITSEIPPVEDKKAEETAPAVAPTEEKKEEKPKPTKRGSIFGNFAQKLKSPTHEKKEADLLPAPAKEPETGAEAPKLDEPATTETAPVLPPVAPVEAAPLESTNEALKADDPKEAKPATTTPHKEKQSFSFGKFLGGSKDKAKSPATEKAPELPKTEEAPKTEETPAVAAPATAEPVTESPKDEAKEEPAAEAATTTPTTKEKKRGSIFGALGRAVSKAGKPKKEKETTPAAEAAEATEPKEEKSEVAPIAEETKEDPAATATEPAKIGDVVPEAVAVGQDSKSTPQVSATA